MVLLDAAFPNGLEALKAVRAADLSARVVVFALSETEENIVAWARAGSAGYIPTTAALREAVEFIESIDRGEQICSAAIASRLMRRIGSLPNSGFDNCDSRLTASLTGREHQIIGMIAEGLSNKQIARRLKIELSTTKSHVHNLLQKLGLERRGQIAYRARTDVDQPHRHVGPTAASLFPEKPACLPPRRVHTRGFCVLFAPHLLRRLIFAEADIDRMSQEAVGRPGQISDLGNDLRLDPMNARQNER